MFLVAVVAMGASGVFATGKPVQDNSVKSTKNDQPVYTCEVRVMCPDGKSYIQSFGVSTIDRQDACDRAYANTRGLECPRNAGGGGTGTGGGHLEEIEQSN
jgi:hypothetical protein